MKIQIMIYAFALSYMTNQIYAQDLITDRPDQTESSSVVPKGTVQIETGLFLEKDKMEVSGQDLSAEYLHLATTLFRIGVLNFLELRIGSEYEMDKIEDSEVNGINGLELGTKIRLTDEKGWKPESALILSAGLPVGNKNFTGDRVVPGFLFALSHTLSHRLGFGTNLGGEYREYEIWESIYSVALGIAISDEIGGFVEIYGSKARDEETSALFDTGLTWLLKPNMQLDTSFGYAFTEDAPDWFINGGFTIRLPQ